MQEWLAAASVGADPYVVATIPRTLEASARLAVAELYQPFFVDFAEGVRLVVRHAEWERLAERFPGATVETGYRLISLPPPPGVLQEAEGAGAGSPPPADVAALVRWLGDRGIPVRALRSFFRDHLLVAEADLPVLLEARERKD